MKATIKTYQVRKKSSAMKRTSIENRSTVSEWKSEEAQEDVNDFRQLMMA
jgi:hypothetical protein